MRPRPLFWLGVAFLLAVGAWLIAGWIVTDREAIAALMEEAVEAVKAGDFGRFAATLDTDYEAEGRDRDAMVDYVRTLWRRTRPGDLDAVLDEIQVEGDDAWGAAEVRANVLGRPTRIPVQVTWRRTEDGWRIASAKPIGWAR